MRFSVSPLLSSYAAACAAGFVLDIALLELLMTAGCSVHIARAISILPAALVTYLLQNRYTFANYKDVRTAQGTPVPFGALSLAAIILNYAVFTRVLRIPEPPARFMTCLMAMLAGGIAAYGANWALLQSVLEKSTAPAGAGGSAPVSVRGMAATGALRKTAIWIAALFMVFDSPGLLHQLHAIMAYPNLALPLGPADTDVWLRLAQVRQWLSSGFAPATFSNGAFFDHHVADTNGPFGGVSTPWTRPVDAIVAALAQFTPANLDIKQRLLLAALWMPSILTCLNLIVLNKAARLHNRLSSAAGITVLLFMLSSFYYLEPGNSDHHGLLSLLWCAAIWLLLAEKLPFVLGAIMGLSIWISPEALITTGFVFALLGAEGLLLPEKMRRLFFAACGAAAVCAIGLFVEMPAADIPVRQTYDTLSMVQECLLLLTALSTGALAAILPRLSRLKARVVAAAVAGAAILAGEYFFYPGFFAGPMRDVDGIVFSKMLPRITEAKPLFVQKPFVFLQVLMWVVPALAVLGAALRRPHRAATQRQAIITLAALLATLGLTLVQTRWQYYLQPVAVLALASFLPVYAMGAETAGAKQTALAFMKGLPRWARPYALCWMVYLAVMLTSKAFMPQEVPANAYCYTQISYALQTQQLQGVLGEEPKVLFVPRDEGGEAQFFTPYRIIASNYHREGAGLTDMMAIENAATSDEALPLLKKRQVGALLTCPGLYPDTSWLSKIGTAPPAWMTPVELPKPIKMQGEKPLLFTLHLN